MAIENGYTTLEEVKAALRITDDIDDPLLELAIESASREIDGYCERVFYSQGTATKLYRAEDSFRVFIDDLDQITTLETSSDGRSFQITWDETDYQLEPVNSTRGGTPWPFTSISAIGRYLFPIWHPRHPDAYEATVRVTGVWGWPSVPTAVRQAAVLLAIRQFKRYDSPLGIAGGFGDMGAMRVVKVDPDVEALIQPFRKVFMA